MKKIIIALAAAALLSSPAMNAQQRAGSPEGGISKEMLAEISKGYEGNASDKAIRNALACNPIATLALNSENAGMMDTHFSDRVRTKGITDQKSSGRCWLFTGLNVLRAKIIDKYDLPALELSQNYLYFYDQLEKANLFLQGVIDTKDLPYEDRTVDWLFRNPLGDGGQFTGVSNLILKYGIVPAEVMPESYNANNTSRMSAIIALKLREYGLALRQGAAQGQKPAVLEKRKVEMLGTIYRILSTCLGEPPTTFKWTMKDANGRPVSTKEYTPKSFYDEYVGEDLKNNYVMLMNDPSRPYHRTYTIDMDRHSYDGAQWTYLNLPIEEIKPLAIASIKDSTMMYFSCDVGKFYDSKTGVLCTENFDYATLFDTDFPMDKADRIRTFASASSHAMTLMAVDLDAEGKPTKWMVENSWGPNSGVKGHLIMTDKWFDEYMFRVVVEKRFVPEKLLKLYNHEPTRLPAWDPLFSEDK